MGYSIVRYAVAGGYAVALHGAVRGTVDVDVVLALSKKNVAAAERAFLSIGLKSRLPVTASEVFLFREEYIRNRNLTAWSFVDPSNPTDLVDVVITHDLARMKVQRVRAAGRVVPVLAIDDLIGMKRAAGRPQDLEDIKALEKLR